MLGAYDFDLMDVLGYTELRPGSVTGSRRYIKSDDRVAVRRKRYGIVCTPTAWHERRLAGLWGRSLLELCSECQ